MLSTLTSGTVRNIQVEVEVATKKVQVNVNENNASAWIPLTEDNQSSVNVSINLETGKKSINMNNLDSIEPGSVIVDQLADKMQAVITELQTL